MASFVHEVLSASGRIGEKEDFNSKSIRLGRKVRDLKSTLIEKVDSRYDDFLASFSEVTLAVSQLEDVLREVEDLERAVGTHLKPGLAASGKEVFEVGRQMATLKSTVQSARAVKAAVTNIEEANELLEQKAFKDALERLRVVDEVLKDLDGQEDDNLESIRHERLTVKASIVSQLTQDWNSNTRIESESDQGTDQVVLELALIDQPERMVGLIQALEMAGKMPFCQKTFGQRLMTLMVKPIIASRSGFRIKSEEKRIVLAFIQDDEERSDPENVIQAVGSIFTVVGRCFAGHPTFLQGLGLGQYIVDAIYKECLMPAIPDQRSHLDAFTTVVDNTELFIGQLEQFHMLNGAKMPTIDIESAFIKKKCADLLVQARLLMRRDLHDSISIKDEQPMSKERLEEITNMTISDEDLLPLPEGLDAKDKLFDFPECQVSRSIVDLVNVIKEYLSSDEIKRGEDRLITTLRNVFEMYNDVLPIAHSESLKSLSLNPALGYNNCMYLAHQCLTLSISEAAMAHKITFIDLVPRLRTTGIDTLLDHMRRLRDELRSMLRDSVTGLGQLDGDTLLPPASEKCLKQILHQLTHLSRVWTGALPLPIYRRAMGTAVNTIAEELVQKVIVLEDITADSAVQICMLYTYIQDNTPPLFEVGDASGKVDIMCYVKKWNRFRELILILNANMREIEDRWASGKGPLASEFEPDEVKRLIRALFQNTDRRAGVLSRIK